MERLNYSTHAVNDILDLSAHLNGIRHPDAERYREFAKRIHKSIKFMLPLSGRIYPELDITENNPLTKHFKLPFDSITLEFEIEQKGGFLGDTDERLVSVPRRLAYCEIIPSYQLNTAIEPSRLRKKFGENVIVIHPVNYMTSDLGLGFSGWRPNLAIAVIGETLDLVNTIYDGKAAFEGTGMAYLPWGDEANKVYAEGRYTEAHMIQDCYDEVMALMQLLYLLDCNNIEIIDNPAPDKLNKKRVKSGKVPFFDYKTLAVKARKKTTGKTGGQGSHKSPVTHLRRGHVRHFANGDTTWINSTTVNPGGDVLEKDYVAIY